MRKFSFLKVGKPKCILTEHKYTFYPISLVSS